MVINIHSLRIAVGYFRNTMIRLENPQFGVDRFGPSG
jgi:hypothetical protein